MRSAGTKIVTILASLVLSWATPVSAFDPSRPLSGLTRDVWTSEDGLPADSVKTIAETPDGYLWVGTQAGLVRFDGARFLPVVDARGGSLGDVESLFVGSNGGVWIGTVLGVYRVSAAGRIERFGPPEGETWARPLVLEDGAGRVWLGTREGGPLRRLEDGRFEPFHDASGRTVRWVSGVALDTDGRPCFVGDEIRCLDPSGEFRVRLDPEDPARAQALELGADVLWATLPSRGLVRVKGSGDSREERSFADELPGLSLFDIEIGPDGTLWFVTNAALGRIVGDRVEVARTRDGDAGHRNFVLHFDRDGDLWVGTMYGGLHRYRATGVRTLSTGEGLDTAHALAVLPARDGSVWLAREGPGVQRLDRDGRLRTYGPDDGLPWNVMSLWEQPDGTVWVGGVGGVARLGPDDRFDPVGEAVGPTLCGLSTPEGVVYAGGVRGVFRWNGRAFENVDWADGWSPVVAMSRADDGSLWISAAGNGVLVRRGDRNSVYAASNGWPTAAALGFVHAAQGDVWIPTYDRGLVRIRGDRVRRIGKEHGLPTESFYQAVDDGRGRLWLSTGQGVLTVSFDDLERAAETDEGPVAFRRWGTGDGMRDAECNGGQQPAGAVDREGRVWFPTADGFAIFDLRTPAEAMPPPAAVIETVRVDGRDETVSIGSVDGRIAFGPGPGNLEVGYTAPTFRGAEELVFRYRLEGYDDDWVEAGERRAALYTRVPPGRYAFRVESSRDGRVWGEAAVVPDLRLRPHFWQTGWFLTAVSLSLVTLAWIFHRARLSRAVEIERMRTRIATDLHDDIGSSLSQVAILSEVVRNRVDGDEQVRSLLGRIGEVSRGVVDAMSDIVWAIDPERDELEDVVQRMRRFGNDTLGNRGVVFRLEAPGIAPGLRVGPDLRRELYLVFKEAIHNAAKHADARCVSAAIRVERNVAVLDVRDDGRGFEDGDRGDGHGLASMRRRAERMGGSLAVSPVPGGGTRVRADIPLRGGRTDLPRQVGWKSGRARNLRRS